MSYKNLIIEKHDPGIFVLKISRPKALNALNEEVLSELVRALKEIELDPSLRALILTGDGDKSFIAGADILEMSKKSSDEGIRFAMLGHQVGKMLRFLPVPVIAAVNGYALGGGTEMAIACDFIYASENAVFGQPEVGLGIIPGFGGTFRLAEFIGIPQAKELIFSGKKIKADEALRLGLVNQIFKQEDLLNETISMAKKIALNSLTAVKAGKKLLNELSDTIGVHHKVDIEVHEFGRLFGTPDQKEGMQAFVDKKKPLFLGLSIEK